MTIGTRWKMASIAAVAVAAVGLVVACSAEHPGSEHPSSEHPSSEHPSSEHSSAEHGAQKITKEKLADSIADYVMQDMKLKNGYFMFYDSRDGEVLTLKLDHVHRERVAQTAGNRYFACADFRAASPQQARQSDSLRAKEGKLFDLDFWMKRGEHGELHVTKITLHKEAGEARYSWYEENGVWKRRK